MDSGLSSGEDSDEDETAPEGFVEVVKKAKQVDGPETGSNISTNFINKYTLLLRSKEDKKRASHSNKAI